MQDFVYSTYNALFEAGWRMQDIDEMDILGYLKIRAWKLRREEDKKKPVRRYIDDVWPGLKP